MSTAPRLTIEERAQRIVDFAPRMFAPDGAGRWRARSTRRANYWHTLTLRSHRPDGSYDATCNCEARGDCIHLALARKTIFPAHFAAITARDLSVIESQPRKSQLFREPEELPVRTSLMDHLRVVLTAEVS